MSRLTIVIVAILGAASLSAQTVPKMRSRMLTSLTNTEIEQYLERNDVIFVPVGTVEPHAGLPLDCEYVGPLAYATLFAEKARPITAEQRDALATRGMAMYKEAVEAVDIAGILQAMRDHDRFTQERILPGQGWMFPKP